MEAWTGDQAAVYMMILMIPFPFWRGLDCYCESLDVNGWSLRWCWIVSNYLGALDSGKNRNINFAII